MNRQWGTPKTPAPSGPLTLYVGPSRDAGRLRARQDRHRAAAPALSNGDGLSKQTHSAVLARALRGLGAGRAFAASGGPLCWRAADHPRRLSITSIPSRSSRPTCHVTLVTLLEAPSKLSRSCPPTCPTPSATCLLSRGVLLSRSTPLGATLPEFQARLLPPSPPGRNALPRTSTFCFRGPSQCNCNQSRCSVEKSASPLYTAT